MVPAKLIVFAKNVKDIPVKDVLMGVEKKQNITLPLPSLL